MLGSVLLTALCLAPPPAGPRSRPAAEAAEAALSHYEKGEYAEARAAIARAYMIEPWPEYLFARAQIERADGECVAAHEFYGLYLESDPPDKGAALAREGIAACPIRDEAPASAPARDAAADPDATPRGPDALGIALTSVGGASLVVGAGLYIGTAVQRRAAEGAATHDRFGDHIDRARRLGVAASAMVSIGAAFAVAGIVRLVIVHRRAKARGRLAWRRPPARAVLDGLTLRW